MRHHFGDHLNRKYGHWSIVPNRNRWQYRYENLLDAPSDVSVLTLTKNDTNWERVTELNSLTELTLHEPSKDQLDILKQVSKLTSLRVSHARTKTIEFLESQSDLRELVFEYVSGFNDLTVISELPKLHAVHFENLRRVRDFSPLGLCQKLKQLSIYGTLDWDQPIEKLDFLGQLDLLEYFDLGFTRLLGPFPIFASISKMKSLKEIKLALNAASLEDFAYLEAKAPNVIGAIRQPYQFYEGENRIVNEGDYRAKMPREEFLTLKGASISKQGTRYLFEKPLAFLLGRGTRTVTGSEENILKKCAAHEEKYRSLIAAL